MDLVALLPWDDPVRGVTSAYRNDPPFSYVTEPVKQVRASVPLRVDAQGGLHLLGTDAIVHLDEDGALRGRTPLPAARVLDHACSAKDECAILGEGRLFRNGDSTEVPARFAHVLFDETNGHIYLRAKHSPEVMQLDGDTFRLHEQAGTAFLTAGRLGYAYLDQERNLRGICVVDLRDRSSAVMPGTPEHYPWLVYPFGMDAQSRLYVQRDRRVARIALDGTLEELFPLLEGGAPQVDLAGRVVVAVNTPEGLAIRRR